MVISTKSLVAIGALAHARLQSLFDTLSAEDMAAGFNDSVLEVLPTNSAYSEVLWWMLVPSKQKGDNQTYS